MSYFPMMVNLEGARVLVIGGGEEGRKKVEILSLFRAKITLIATDAQEEAVRLADRYLKREFEDQDLQAEEYALVVAATDDRLLNEQIHLLACKRKIPVNVVDDVEFCTFIFPAIIKEKDVVCSVSSGGKSPYVAQYVKSLIRRSLPCGIGEINDKMGDFRSYAKQEIKEAAARRAFLRKKFDELINGENPENTIF